MKKFNIQYRTLFGLLLSVILAGCGSGGSDDGAVVDNTAVAVPTFTATSVSDALDYGISNGLDGIWVYIDDGSAPSSIATAGVESRTTLAPADPGTLFKIASISKMFIAVSVVRAQAQGIIRLDDTLAAWLPDIAARIDNAGSITIADLVSHRSGVRDFDSEPGYTWSRSYSLDSLLEFIYDKPADFLPDARYAYSNTNYLLLGLLLDEALGYSHHDFVRNEITAPLGLVNTFSVPDDTDSMLLARGYWDNVDRRDLDYLAPGGSMISTVDEVGIFLRALADGTLLSDEEQATYTSLFDVGHSGWLPGYQSLAYYHRSQDTVLVQFTNTTGGNSEQIAQQVYDALAAYLRTRP